jgi:hypothetical protein
LTIAGNAENMNDLKILKLDIHAHEEFKKKKRELEKKPRSTIIKG